MYIISKKSIQFPPAELAGKEGLLAIGGDLSPDRLLVAYRNGIFPWFNDNEPILWWSPDPRFVLYPGSLHIPKSMRPILRKKEFTITSNRCFREVITACSAPRKDCDSTWITAQMIEAYCKLYRLGFAHSIEAWKEGKLAGGFYGVRLGRIFFGESMFTKISNASKAAIITFVKHCSGFGIDLIDCQLYTSHLERFGAVHISRKEYLAILKKLLKPTVLPQQWRIPNEL